MTCKPQTHQPLWTTFLQFGWELRFWKSHWKLTVLSPLPQVLIRSNLNCQTLEWSRDFSFLVQGPHRSTGLLTFQQQDQRGFERLRLHLFPPNCHCKKKKHWLTVYVEIWKNNRISPLFLAMQWKPARWEAKSSLQPRLNIHPHHGDMNHRGTVFNRLKKNKTNNNTYVFLQTVSKVWDW